MRSNVQKTINDIKWEHIFDKYNILSEIKNYNMFFIDSKIINQFRETRLMVKFDHSINLPTIFSENNLSILPVTRNRYVIGNFSTYQSLPDNTENKILYCDFPNHIRTIDYNNLYSESSALHCAYLTKMIDYIVGEETFPTVSGRMSTSSFSFQIDCSIDTSYSLFARKFDIDVNNSQCEIDAGFESLNYYIIIEAKNYMVDDFNIRQLYYPYRLWNNKIEKDILPVLFIYSNNIFHFFLYTFKDLHHYNSLQLYKHFQFSIVPEPITVDDIIDIFEQTNIVDESDKVPFPQADSFERVYDLLILLVENNLEKTTITTRYQFNMRQTDYYTNAGIYLGLIEKYKKRNLTMKKTFVYYRLSSNGKKIMQMDLKNRYLAIAKQILQHEAFHKVMCGYLENNYHLSIDAVTEIIRSCKLNKVNMESTTVRRRSSTVYSWIMWIQNLVNQDFTYF